MRFVEILGIFVVSAAVLWIIGYGVYQFVKNVRKPVPNDEPYQGLSRRQKRSLRYERLRQEQRLQALEIQCREDEYLRGSVYRDNPLPDDKKDD